MSLPAIIVKGIFLGLTLSLLVGPLLFSLIQASIERGFRAGLACAAGIWLSDGLFVVAVLFGVRQIESMVNLPGFEKWAGLAGGLLLAGFGAGNFFSKSEAHFEKNGPTSRSLFPYFMRGFLINSVNPFTVFFWLGITTAVIVPNRFSFSESLVFFAAMLGMLALTDLVKIFLAKKIGSWLTPGHLKLVRRVVGISLIGFGILLIFRVL